MYSGFWHILCDASFFLAQVTKMKMISPSNREVDVGKTLSETEYIGMCRREVLDAYLRDRAKSLGATVYNGLFMRMERVRPMQPLSFQPFGLSIRLERCCPRDCKTVDKCQWHKCVAGSCGHSPAACRNTSPVIVRKRVIKE